jgi:ribokinase
VKSGIFIIGSSNYDIVLKMNDIPVIGETVLANGLETGFGGKGANQAVTLSKLGAEVSFLTSIGDDLFGKLYYDHLISTGIKKDSIIVSEGSHNGIAVINVDKTGKNNIVVYPGANSLLKDELFLAHMGKMNDYKIIITQLEIPIETVVKIAQKKEEDHIFILNPSPINDAYDYDHILNKVDILVPNEIELQKLSGCMIEKEDTLSLSKACDTLIDRGVKNIIVTLGNKGAFIKNERIEELVPVRDVRVIDTEGAGDIFMGAFAFYFHLTEDMITAVKYANEIATLSVTRFGAQRSIPSVKEIKNINKFFGLSS